VLTLINNLLIYYALTNSSNFTMILSFDRTKSHSFQNPKKPGFSHFFSQLHETQVLKFCPKLKTLSKFKCS